jgi:hypothetical protein
MSMVAPARNGLVGDENSSVTIERGMRGSVARGDSPESTSKP